MPELSQNKKRFKTKIKMNRGRRDSEHPNVFPETICLVGEEIVDDDVENSQPSA